MKPSTNRPAIGALLVVAAGVASSGQVQADTVAAGNIGLPHDADSGLQQQAEPILVIADGVMLQGLVDVSSNGNQEVATQVPIPAAAWLFGSAIVGAVALGRRKRALPLEQGQHLAAALPGSAAASSTL